MKKIMILIALFGAVLYGPRVVAQNVLEKQASNQFSVQNYTKAIKLWQKAFESTTEIQKKQQLAFNIGSAFHRMNRFEDAIQWYADALGEEPTQIDWLLAQADAFLRAGNWNAAKSTAAKVLQFNPKSEDARKIIDKIEAFEKQRKTVNIYLTSNDVFNSDGSDYSPEWFNGNLIISSSRQNKKNRSVDGRTAEDFSKLYLFISTLSGEFEPPVQLPVNGNKNAGVLTLDAKHHRVFFTKCSNSRRKCTIMESEFDPKTFVFSKPKPAVFVNKKYHYGHPVLRDDGRKMYFSAQIPGGYGGNDIYSITIKPDGSFGLPINLGPVVNSSSDELFPTTIGDSLLLFSSAAHNGLGGLDIFYAYDLAGRFDEIGPLPYPFNSTSDDFGLKLKPGTKHGVLSSNRNRAKGDDIYFFDGFPIRKLAAGTVKDANTLLPLSNVHIKLTDSEGAAWVHLTQYDGRFLFSVAAHNSGQIEAKHPDYKTEVKYFTKPDKKHEIPEMEILLEKQNHFISVSGVVKNRETKQMLANEKVTIFGTQGLIRSSVTNSEGVYRIDSLAPNQIYTLKIAKEGYFSESRVVKIPQVRMPSIFQKSNGYDLDFDLTPITIKKEIVLNDIFYDFDKATLRESSKIELDKLVSMLRETPKVRIQLSAHTDTRGTDVYNDRLSAARAKSVVDYLQNSGIAPSRLFSKGYGKRFPVYKNATSESQHQANRRTTFQVLDLKAESDFNPSSPPGNFSRIVYRVQILVSATQYDPNEFFSALKQNVNGITFTVHHQGQVFRYEAGDRFTLAEAEALRNQIKTAGYSDCFIVPYIDHKRVSLQQAKDFKP